MNKSAVLPTTAPGASDGDSRRRDEAYRLFPVESLQHLEPEAAARCQALIGHGATLGTWETPESMTGGRKTCKAMSEIDLRSRICAFLDEGVRDSPSAQVLLDAGVLLITRYLLLLRLGPARLNGKRGALDCTTVAEAAYTILPRFVARAIGRRIERGGEGAEALLGSLTLDDVAELSRRRGHAKYEFRRLRQFAEHELWQDAPPAPPTGGTTDPRGKPSAPEAEKGGKRFQPLPDEYLCAFGPRVLWLVHDLGPNLIHLFEAIPELYEGVSQIKGNSGEIQRRLAAYFAQNTWRDREGQAISAPPFPLQTASGRGNNKGCDRCEWPPRTHEQVATLGVTLQSAHLWIAMLVMAGRVSEIDTLKRDCVEWKRDAKCYANGRTYKLTQRLAGTDRDWPAPDVLIHALGQQARLVCAWERIARSLRRAEEFLDDEPGDGEESHGYLWASLGTGGKADPQERLGRMGEALGRLARRVGLTDRPGGDRIHPHRFRKTMARLAGIAIVDSPRVLKQLLGHKDIAMTLHYICTDKALAAEIEQVARELRIMRSQEVLEAVRASMHSSTPPKFGGGGVPGLQKMIREREEELHRTGEEWDAATTYDLAVLLTSNGHYVRVTRPGVICLKPAPYNKPCTCDSSCENRIERRIDDETTRRNMLSVIPILLEDGKRALDEGQTLMAADKLRQIEEDLGWLGEYGNEYAGHPDLRELREALA